MQPTHVVTETQSMLGAARDLRDFPSKREYGLAFVRRTNEWRLILSKPFDGIGEAEAWRTATLNEAAILAHLLRGELPIQPINIRRKAELVCDLCRCLLASIPRESHKTA